MSTTTVSGVRGSDASARSGSIGLRDRITGAIRKLIGAWAAESRRRRRLRTLSGLSERTLADLGLTRAELQSIAYYGATDRTRRRRGG